MKRLSLRIAKALHEVGIVVESEKGHAYSTPPALLVEPRDAMFPAPTLQELLETREAGEMRLGVVVALTWIDIEWWDSESMTIKRSVVQPDWQSATDFVGKLLLEHHKGANA